MPHTSTFHELAYALPEEERRELYRRIMSSLGLGKDNEQRDTIVPTQIHPEQRRDIIEREIGDLGLWGRLRLWLRSWLTGKPRQDAFVDLKLLSIRKQLLSAEVCPRASATELIAAEFGRRLFVLFQAAAPVASVFEDMWQSQEMLRNVIQLVLEHRIPQAKTSLMNFMTDEEMKEIYVVGRSKTEIRNHLLERLDAYIGRIHHGVFDEIAAGVTPLYYMKGLALFDYVQLLAVFGYNAGDSPAAEVPELYDVRATDIIEQLEELYYAFYTWQRLEGRIRVHREFLDYYLRAQQAMFSDDAPNDAEIRTQAEAIEQDIRGLHEAAAVFIKHNPLADMIKYHHADPYYRFVVYVPKINLKDFYYNALRVLLLEQIDQRFEVVREGAIEVLIDETFGHHPPDFPNFRSGGASAVNRLGLPTFRHVRSLNILYNYIQIIYRRVFRQQLTLIHRTISSRHRDLSNELSFYAAGLEDVAGKITAFDETFSPDSDEGKSFYRVRHTMEKDLSQQRVYRSIVMQRDRQSRLLVEKGLEHLQGMLAVLSKLRTLQGGLKADDGEASAAAQALIERYASSLERITKLVRLILSAEENPG
ncbi:MAG: hypothetical protein EA404_04635 [Spirochaetaceae bacterium]|nr:MAG: hypothetical protein EA404_04635 [Spirochaetaceae bacterium]